MTEQDCTTEVTPSVLTVKRAIQALRGGRSTTAAVMLVVMDTTLYVFALAGTLWFPWWPVRLLCSIVAGLAVAILFILAHDACHGSLTSSSRINAVVGRMCFLPALYPFSPWAHGHNHLHHGWTNLKEKDYGWRPFSLAEYRALPVRRRVLERIYRTLPGVALYSIVEIWWTHMMHLTEEDRRSLNHAAARFDRGLVAAYVLVTLAIVMPFGPAAVLLSLLFPWLVFQWLFGTLTLQHHTHPRTRWFRTRKEWSFYEGQIANTVHIVFPRIVELVLHNITVHGAHHADPRVPLYSLPAVQSQLERTFGADVIVERWTLSTYRRLLKTCRLYDYDQHRWLDFDGTPTTP
jgi:omega-6 fatty acid desaturase (delta-12 desaturase)